jgi:O-acetyl-ADP-ribose deacetylase (regulator of RNase III)
MIHYIIGDATKPVDSKFPPFIVHIVNDIGAWGKGFVLALSAKWPEPQREYKKKWPHYKLGDIQPVLVAGGLIVVVNMYAQRGIYPLKGKPPIRYGELRQCLDKVYQDVSVKYNGSVHMPRIGCGLAGGSWPVVEQIIHDTLVSKGVEVYVYDLPKR